MTQKSGHRTAPTGIEATILHLQGVATKVHPSGDMFACPSCHTALDKSNTCLCGDSYRFPRLHGVISPLQEFAARRLRPKEAARMERTYV